MPSHPEQATPDPAIHATREDAWDRSRLLHHLASLRAAQGITQAQAAQRMQTTQSHISDLENGGTDPALSTLQRYARALGAHLDITLTPAPPAHPTPQDPTQ
jgi:transcriptional regulator with XRE-family HTH domain